MAVQNTRGTEVQQCTNEERQTLAFEAIAQQLSVIGEELAQMRRQLLRRPPSKWRNARRLPS